MLAIVLATSTASCGRTSDTEHVGNDVAPAPEAAPSIAAADAVATIRREGNHLRDEPSPYLQHHAHNPIDWYPWGPEALARAKREGKPIFLSIGYSTCHWCHVMARESFDDDEIAAFLNRHFVAIKVDREQRPDVDALYLAAVAAQGGPTGWPLNVFLTPSLTPIVGGTYFPARGSAERPGFFELAQRVQQGFATHGEASARDGAQVLAALARERGDGSAAIDLELAFAQLARTRDEVRGGFGGRQKFPNAPLLLAELRRASLGDGTDTPAARDHLATTLERMADGGLRDHLAGSFHRYTVDADWGVPHFEKTLYDNAQLALLYLEAGTRFDRDDWRDIARSILDDLLAQWRTDDGGFVVGFDADDAGGEGTFYTWTSAELEAALGPERGAVVAQAWRVDTDDAARVDGRSVLQRSRSVSAEQVAIAVAALPELAAARRTRPAPARDDKVIVAWNALAIAALAEGARVLDEPRYLEAASATTARLRQCCVHGDRVLRGVRGDASLGEGQLDDHAMLAWALLRLHAASGQPEALRLAHALALAVRRDFWDPTRAGLRRRADIDDLPVATLDMDDGAMPSGGAAAVASWLELGLLLGDDGLYETATTTLQRWSPRAQTQPSSSGFLLATAVAATRLREVVVAGDDDEATRALLAALREPVGTRFVLARIPAAGITGDDAAAWPALVGKRALAGPATAFVCERGSCSAPTNDPARLRAQLAAAFAAPPPTR